MSAVTRLVTLAIVALLAITTAGARQHAPTATRSRAPLLPGMGDTHHKVATNSAEAQRYFDQGLALVYAFNHEEAARSFQYAAQLDPACAMAYWGVALAVGPNYNEADIDAARMKAAVDAVNQALALIERVPANEQAYIRALAKRYSADPQADRKKLAADYRRAMEQVARDYPDDPDAGTLYAESMMDLHPWQLWNADGKPAEDTPEILRVLEGVLRREPNHLGANHFYIHATEASPHPERALASAVRLRILAPAAGHLVHMPAHVYMRTGDYHKASLANEQAIAADRAYIAQQHAAGAYPMMYYSHNLHFMAVSASMEGRFAEADAAAREVAERAAGVAAEMPMAEWFVPTRAFVLVRFRRWKDVKALPEPSTNLRLAHAFWRFARGMAFAGTADAKGAAAERRTLAAEAQAVPADTPIGLNTAHQLLDLATGVLDAAIARQQHNLGAAAESLRSAAKIEDALNYDEPPDWYLPVRESLGAVLIDAGRLAEAEKVFREELVRRPKNPRALFGLAACLEKQKKDADAARVRAQFQAGWHYADTPLRLEDL